MSKVIIEQNTAALIKLAKDFNFWGKRIRDSKITVCECILKSLEIEMSNSDLCDWLEENQPVKPSKAPRSQSNKLAADTMTGEAKKKLESLDVLQSGKFIITSAQNNTAVSPVFAQLKELAESMEATLIVLPIHYNKTAFSAAKESDSEYFAPEVHSYLEKSDVWIDSLNMVRLIPSANVLPTAKQPINVAAQLNIGELATIVPATKQQMLTLPRLPSQPIKEAWTTGSCTAYNYTESRAGSEAETEHVFGGLFVSIEDGKLDITNLRQGEDGSLVCELLGCSVNMGSVYERPSVVLGDLHCEMQDKKAYGATLNWLENIQPQNIAVHDILHFSTRSHHNRQSGKHLFKMWVDGNTVKKDLLTVIKQINELADYCDNLYIVESNHNSALDNWLDDSAYNPKQDPENAKLYYLLNYAVCEALEQGVDDTALEIAMRDIIEQSDLPSLAYNIHFGAMDKPEMWSGIDVSQHGHKGQNGSIGNPNQFAKWRIKLVTGHTHSPKIVGDVLTVGVLAKLNQGYNKGGATSWNQANAIIHSNGVPQMVRVFPLTK